MEGACWKFWLWFIFSITLCFSASREGNERHYEIEKWIRYRMTLAACISKSYFGSYSSSRQNCIIWPHPPLHSRQDGTHTLRSTRRHATLRTTRWHTTLLLTRRHANAPVHKTAIEILLCYRSLVGLKLSNQFLYVCAPKGTPISYWNALKKSRHEAGLGSEKITSTSLNSTSPPCLRFYTWAKVIWIRWPCISSTTPVCTGNIAAYNIA